jgi:hypothetical protein
MTSWLDENCGADGWAMTPSGMRGVRNDAVSIYFLDATLASAFVVRWCADYKVETAEGVLRIRTDEPMARTTALAPNAVIQKKPRLAFGERSCAAESEDPAIIVQLPYSASGCFEGWASAKAGMAMQVS